MENSEAAGMAVLMGFFGGFALVVASSIWVYTDAKAIGVRKGQVSGFADMSPFEWFWACLLLWIIGFPLYLAGRSELKRINAGGRGVSPRDGGISPAPSLPTTLRTVASSVPADAAIRVSRQGTEFGPYSVAELETFAAEGRLQATDHCWYEGLAEWVPLPSLLRASRSTLAPLLPSAVPKPPPVPRVDAPPLPPQFPPSALSASPRSFPSSGHVPESVGGASHENRPARKALILGGLLTVVGAIVLAFVLAGPSLKNAADRTAQRRTIADIRNIATVVEAYAIDNNRYPSADKSTPRGELDPYAGSDVDALGDLVAPTYIKVLPSKDAWGNPFIYSHSHAVGPNRDEEHYSIVSFGKDGRPDTSPVFEATTDVNSDIIFSDGEFLRYPENRGITPPSRPAGPSAAVNRTAGVPTPAAAAEVSVYSYFSPAAKAVLESARITDKELEAFAAAGLTSRSIRCTESNAVYEGSEDSLRLDIRDQAGALSIELSVRQGASVHNMLQRWAGRRVLPVDARAPQDALRSALLDSISALLDDLKDHYDSPAYRQGQMMEE